MATDPVDHSVCVANYRNGTASIATGSTVPTGRTGADAVAVDPAGGVSYLANMESNTVTEVPPP